MRGARDDLELPGTRQEIVGLAIELEDELVLTADDQKSRRGYARQDGARQIGPASA